MGSKFDDFSDHMNNVFSHFSHLSAHFNCVDTMKNVSVDDSNKESPVYVFNSNNPKYNSMKVVSMDYIVKEGYKEFKGATTKYLPNTCDAFLIDKNGIWYFIEFKNSKVNNVSDNLEKKGLNNILMLIDIFKHTSSNPLIPFNNDDPLDFIRNNCVFIVVFPKEKDPISYDIVKHKDNSGEKYTPNSLIKFKEFYFKDAYAYTVELFESKFIKNFSY